MEVVINKNQPSSMAHFRELVLELLKYRKEIRTLVRLAVNNNIETTLHFSTTEQNPTRRNYVDITFEEETVLLEYGSAFATVEKTRINAKEFARKPLYYTIRTISNAVKKSKIVRQMYNIISEILSDELEEKGEWQDN
ncbi:MAG: hypothetical protein ABDH28_04295 [Brevinematia bacterium]